jgi:hypothetical protein
LTTFREKIKGFDFTALLQKLGIAGGAILSSWTIWSFFLKEIVIPSLTPSNINIEAHFKRLKPIQNTMDTKNSPPMANHLHSSNSIPIQLNLKVTNLGVNSLRLENPIWMAYEVSLDKPITDSKAIQEAVVSQINSNLGLERKPPAGLFRYSSYTELKKLMGIGTVLIGGDIKPGEVIESQRIILSPKDANYDYLQVKLWVPTHKNSTKEIKVIVSTSGYPYYHPQVQFCSPRSGLKRSALQRIDSLAKSDSSGTTSKNDTCNINDVLNPRKMNQLGAQFSKTEHEIMLNPNFSDNTN